MWIECDIPYDYDCVSYQDTFKQYFKSDNKANNVDDYGEFRLCGTDGYMEDTEDEYDDYHERYCAEVREVSYHGRTYYCDVEDLDDFVWMDAEHGHAEGYYHINDLWQCSRCDTWVHDGDEYYSTITEERYCCEECLEEAEEECLREYGIDTITGERFMESFCRKVHIWHEDGSYTTGYVNPKAESFAGLNLFWCNKGYYSNIDEDELKEEKDETVKAAV